MSDQMRALIAIVGGVTVSVWTVALVSRTVDLGILPARRRRRVEWCRAHYRRVRLAGAGLLAVLVLCELVGGH